MAAFYVEALLAHQPEGPYLLGGHSFGGVVSYEIARQLKERGREVAFLVLLDSGYWAGAGASDRVETLFLFGIQRETDRHALGTK